MRRRTVILAAVGVALLAVAYTIYWFALAGIVARDIAAWAELNRSRGYAISYVEPVLGGFPLAVTVRFVDPDIASPDRLWHWQGPETELRVLPWAPYDLQFSAPGRHWISTGGAEPRDIQLAAGWLSLDLHLRDGIEPNRFAFTLAQAQITDSRLGESSIGRLAAEARLPYPPPADSSASSLDLIVHASMLKLPSSLPLPLGREIYSVHLVAQVMGAFPEGAPRNALAAWSEAGGDVELRRLEFFWGGLYGKGDGTFALDKQLQPLFAGSFSVGNLARTLDRFAAAGLVSSGMAAAAKIMFAALSTPPPGGGIPQVSLPLTIQDGFLYLGPLKLAALRPLDWSWLP